MGLLSGGLPGADGDQQQPARPWPYLPVAPSPPGVRFRGGHAACSVREQVLVELHSLVGDKHVASEAQIPQALPAPHLGPPHLARHMVADGHDGCVTQLKDAENLTAHDSQHPPGHKGSPPKHTLQEALGHCWGPHRRRVRVVWEGEGRGGGQGTKEKGRREKKPRKRRGGEGRVEGRAYLGSVPTAGGPPHSSTADSSPETILA